MRVDGAGDVLVYIDDQCVLGSSQEEAIRIFQSIRQGQAVHLRVCRGYPLMFDAETDQIVTQDAYALSSSSSTLQPSQSTAATVSVHISKGNDGFGFTIADSIHGHRVKKILYPSRCPGLCEGDILCEINGLNVRRISHVDIVGVLRDCPVGQRATITVLHSASAGAGSPATHVSSCSPFSVHCGMDFCLDTSSHTEPSWHSGITADGVFV